MDGIGRSELPHDRSLDTRGCFTLTRRRPQANAHVPQAGASGGGGAASKALMSRLRATPPAGRRRAAGSFPRRRSPRFPQAAPGSAPDPRCPAAAPAAGPLPRGRLRLRAAAGVVVQVVAQNCGGTGPPQFAPWAAVPPATSVSCSSSVPKEWTNPAQARLRVAASRPAAPDPESWRPGHHAQPGGGTRAIAGHARRPRPLSAGRLYLPSGEVLPTPPAAAGLGSPTSRCRRQPASGCGPGPGSTSQADATSEVMPWEATVAQTGVKARGARASGERRSGGGRVRQVLREGSGTSLLLIVRRRACPPLSRTRSLGTTCERFRGLAADVRNRAGSERGLSGGPDDCMSSSAFVSRRRARRLLCGREGHPLGSCGTPVACPTSMRCPSGSRM